MSSRWAAAVLAVTLLAGMGGSAHDLLGVADEPDGDEARVTDALTATNDVTTRQVIARLNLWPAGGPVVVCFYGGSPVVRRNVIGIASEWTARTSLAFDFGQDPGRNCSGMNTEDIRVSFIRTAGNKSWIGQESHAHRGPSLNLDGFDQSPAADPKFRASVLHEFGHAVGFWHEQQHPDAPCDFDKNHIMQKFGWSEEQYRVSLQRVEKDERKYKFFLYDKLSVMHYSLDAEFFSSGSSSRCFIPPNSVLSDGDTAAVRDAYPVAVTPQSMNRGIELQVLQNLITDSRIGALVQRRLNSF